MKRLFENFVLKGTDWLFRKKSIEALLLKLGFGTLIAVFAGGPLLVELLRIFLEAVPEQILEVQDSIQRLEGYIFGLCTLVILFALFLIVYKKFQERKSNSRKCTIVIEGRGLRDDDGDSLDAFIGQAIDHQMIPIKLDLRNRLDGMIIEPERTVDKVEILPQLLQQHKDGFKPEDLTVIYGGLTSVPYTFLTGTLIDDEGSIVVYDWDRKRESWRELDQQDDLKSFVYTEIDDLSGVNDVVLAISFSYPVDLESIRKTFSIPLATLELDGRSSDAHWSNEKQVRLAQDFFEIVKNFSANGINRIHLVLAAPNSVVFNFGRRYDKRNLPELVVYQYERGGDIPYPWGILQPVSGIGKPEVIYNS